MYQSKVEVNEQRGRKINLNVDGCRKLIWKEVCKVKGGRWRFAIE